VFGRALLPDRTGLVASFARPGGNLTGVTFIGPEYGKRLELLREVAPKLSRVALLYNDKNAASVLALEETQQWAKSLRVVLEPLGVHDRPSLGTAFVAMRRRRTDALMTTADPLVASYPQAHRGLRDQTAPHLDVRGTRLCAGRWTDVLRDEYDRDVAPGRGLC